MTILFLSSNLGTISLGKNVSLSENLIPSSSQAPLRNNYTMVFTAPFLCVALALLTGSATAAPSTSDWKTTLGWDGVVSSPDSIGSPLTPGDLTTRAASTVGGIFICDQANWNGTCGFAVQPLKTCIVLGTDWNKKISSIGPDFGTVVVGFNATDCTGPQIAFLNPGTGDLASLGWDDTMSSFEAFAVDQ